MAYSELQERAGKHKEELHEKLEDWRMEAVQVFPQAPVTRELDLGEDGRCQFLVDVFVDGIKSMDKKQTLLEVELDEAQSTWRSRKSVRQMEASKLRQEMSAKVSKH